VGMGDDVRRSKAIEAFNLQPLWMQCPTRKAPWRTEQEATKEAERLNSRPDGTGKAYAFHCEKCDRWHTGRPHKGKTVH
jgi:hypothetical protein